MPVLIFSLAHVDGEESLLFKRKKEFMLLPLAPSIDSLLVSRVCCLGVWGWLDCAIVERWSISGEEDV